MGLMACPELSVNNYQHMLHNIQEERWQKREVSVAFLTLGDPAVELEHPKPMGCFSRNISNDLIKLYRFLVFMLDGLINLCSN